MVTFLIAVLLVSMIGMMLLLGLKRYELSSGAVLFGSFRPRVSAFLDAVMFWTLKALPLMVMLMLRHAWEWLASWAKRTLARGIILLERVLEKVLHTVREKTADPREPGEASAFLREVADHKKTLLKRKKRSIFESFDK